MTVAPVTEQYRALAAEVEERVQNREVFLAQASQQQSGGQAAAEAQALCV